MYGAYWCSHCYNQKQELGAEVVAAGMLAYVECDGEGFASQVCALRVCVCPQTSMAFTPLLLVACHRVAAGTVQGEARARVSHVGDPGQAVPRREGPGGAGGHPRRRRRALRLLPLLPPGLSVLPCYFPPFPLYFVRRGSILFKSMFYDKVIV